MDPLGFGGGDVNQYRFAGNNPTDGTDDTGLFSVLGNVSDGWFGDLSNFSAGVSDKVSFGGTQMVRQALGYDDVVNYSSAAYGYGRNAGQVTNIGLMLANPAGAAGWCAQWSTRDQRSCDS